MSRTLPPVYSPLSLMAIASGVRAAASVGHRALALASIERFASADAARLRLFDSGTSALTEALAVSAAASRRPVAMPAFACFDLATAVLGAEVPFVFYDISPETLGPDIGSLRAALERGADRIVVVHLYGHPVDLDVVTRLADEFGAVLIEDAAQGVGARYAGHPLGSTGSLSILSFGRGKGATGGRGGALVANDARGAQFLARVPSRQPHRGSLVKELVAVLAQWALSDPSLYSIPASLPFLGLGETHFRAPTPAAGMSAFAMGVLHGVQPLLEHELHVRRARAQRLAACLVPEVGRAMVPVPHAEPGYLRLPVLASPATANRPVANRPLGILPSYPLPLPALEALRGKAPPVEAPGAKLLSERLVTLPVHSRLAARDLERLEAWCRGKSAGVASAVQRAVQPGSEPVP